MSRAGRKKKLTPVVLKRIKELVSEYPDLTLERMRRTLQTEGIELSSVSVFNGLKYLGIKRSSN